MDAQIIEREAFNVVGVRAHGLPKELNFTAIWNQYMAFDEQLKPLSTDGGYYGLWCGTPDDPVPDYIAGMAVREGVAPPAGLVLHRQPATRYAVFECTMNTIGQTYSYIYDQWLAASPYEFNPGCGDFEYYPPNTTNDSPCYIYLPVREKATTTPNAAPAQEVVAG
jgi:predicted transcriptional regulator YdeE